MKQPDFLNLTNDTLAESINAHVVEMSDPAHDELAAHVGRISKWREVVRLAGSIAVIYGRTLPPVELIQVGIALALRQGWNAAGDAVAAAEAQAEIGYLMSDDEMEALRREIRTKP